MKMIQLKSSDEETFEVDEEAASGSQTIKNMIEDDCIDSAIPLPNVDSKILAKIVEYLKYHATAVESDEEYKLAVEEKPAFVKEFLNVDHNTLFDLLVAANYLNIQSLIELICKTVAEMMIGKTPEEIRAKFHIKNDFTPKEEADVRKEYAWAFE